MDHPSSNEGKEIQRIELDAISPESDSESESDTSPVDWFQEALEIKNRLKDQQQPANEEVKREDSPKKIVEPKKLENETPILQNPDDACKYGFLEKRAETYELEKYQKNAMIIFNHETFFGKVEKRKYTMKDEEALRATFKKFGFTVDNKHLDLPKEPLMKKLKEFCSQDFSQYGCICAVVMTHGAKNGWLRAYDIRYSEHEFIDCFNVETNITLLGKPVIIIIQACRGDEPANAVNHNTSKQKEEVELDFDEPYTLPTEADRLIFHSSYKGRASVSATGGSWFIQALCDKINMYADLDDFETICRAVRRDVAIEKQHEMRLRRKNIVVKQMPVVTTCLTRLLYFKRCGGTDEGDGICQNMPCRREYKTSALRVYRENTSDVDESNEYLDYLRNALRLFIRENPQDEMAQSIQNVVQNDSIARSAKAAMVDLIRNYLITNLDRFTHRELVYLGRPHTMKMREEKQTWCSIV